jgi:hypothetical protein
MRILLNSAVILIVTCINGLPAVQARDIFVNQNGSGTQDGTTIANSRAVAWVNAATNWLTSSQSIQPGDTLRLSGSFTTPLLILGSGQLSAPITIKFEPNAVFSRPHWNNGTHNSAIFGDGVSNIVVDGGSNGLIEATSNGTALANQVNNYGISFNASQKITVTRVTSRNLYVRTPYSTIDSNSFGCGVLFKGGVRDIMVSQCTNSQSATGIQMQYRVGDANLTICSNRCNQYVIAALVGGETGGCTVTNVQIFSNDFSDSTAFAGHPDLHANCIHVHCVQTGGSRLDGLRIFNNYLHGDPGDRWTSFAFLEGYIEGPIIYNNVFYWQGTNSSGNGFLVLKQGNNAKIFNNSFVSWQWPSDPLSGTGVAIGVTDWADTETGIQIRNNLFWFTNFAYYDGPLGTLGSADFNCYYPPSIGFRAITSGTKDWASWTLAGFDTNGSTNKAALDPSFQPLSTDIALLSKGQNLSSFFTADKDGRPRPPSGPWTIGAFEPSGMRPPILLRPNL